MVLPQRHTVLKNLLKLYHDSVEGGHSGVLKTYKRVNSHYYGAGMKKEIRDSIAKCDICKKVKSDSRLPGG